MQPLRWRPWPFRWRKFAEFGHPYVEALVIAILVGMVIRTTWQPGPRWRSGIAFSAKQLLEFAVMLLGAALNLTVIAKSGVLLVGAVVGIVATSLVFSFGVSRLLGLSRKLSILIACGNSICGNSAIAAVAPVIEASTEEIGASISFTAILGVLAVVGLPLLVPLFGLSAYQYGIVAGLTVYAVPQVLAATVPIGIVSVQIGTFVKLMRVVLLGPVVIAISLWYRGEASRHAAGKSQSVKANAWLPWFIPGFVLLAILRSAGIVPDIVVAPIASIAGFLTIVSMAALGLGVDVRVIGRVGPQVVAAVTFSLALILALSLITIHLF